MLKYMVMQGMVTHSRPYSIRRTLRACLNSDRRHPAACFSLVPKSVLGRNSAPACLKMNPVPLQFLVHVQRYFPHDSNAKLQIEQEGRWVLGKPR